MSVLISIFVWRLPIKIVKYFLNLEPAVATQRSIRRRPLHTCGASLVAVTQRACTKLQGFGGPIGSTAMRAVSFMNLILPFVYSLMYPMFPLLLLIDDHIITFESKAEAIFPPSKILFDKFDGLVCSTESLPEHVDQILTNLPSVIHRFSFLDRLLVFVMSWINCIISILTRLVTKNTREKETPIDPRMKPCSSHERNNNATRGNHLLDRLHFLRNQTKVLEEPPFVDSPKYTSYQFANSSPMSDCSEGEISSFNRVRKPDMNCSYKEMLEKGHREINDEGEAEAAETVGKNSNEGAAIASAI